MSTRNLHWLLLAGLAASACVQSRPSRNGVFNENQYVRKDFLIQEPEGVAAGDPGWWLKGTITQISTPNPLGGPLFGLSPGIDSGAVPVRFVVTSDKLQMVSTREIANTSAASAEDTATVVNAWPITNVDLQYQVNLDGETTNFYQTNQERPWQQREWVQVNFDKNDMSDVAPLGEYLQNTLSTCVDMSNVSTTLVPNSFIVDTANNYMQWSVQITLPLIWNDANCVNGYGSLGQEAANLGKQSVTFTLMYSMMRTLPIDQVTYQPLVVSEKDGIHHKYGFFPNNTYNRDPVSGLLASQQQVTRWDPTKPIVWYFAQGFKPEYKHYWTDPVTGIVDRTNAILMASGAAARVAVKEYDDPTGLPAGEGPRQYGDIRYSFLVWMADQDTQESFAGVTEFDVDYRTGEMLSANIAFNEFAFNDYYVQRIDAYLQSVGASAGVNPIACMSDSDCPAGDTCSNGICAWPVNPAISENAGTADPTVAACALTMSANSCPITVTNNVTGTTTPMFCPNGSTLPISSVVDASVHNGTSTVFGKMQGYLGKPLANYGNLGPQAFISIPSLANDTDFLNAYYAYLPYKIYADPAQNFYTVPEGGNGTFGPPSTTPDTMWGLQQQETQFQAMAALINSGQSPFDASSANPNMLQDATAFANTFRALGQAHQQYQYALKFVNGQAGMRMDGLDSLAFEQVADTAGRACLNGQWETPSQWQTNMGNAYWAQVEFHEFGHSMGLTHNFMGSVDAPHYPTWSTATGNNTESCKYGAPGCYATMHTSSIMEYNAEIDRVTWAIPDWGPYDKGAIGWIYANNGQQAANATLGGSISNQIDATHPWNDPLGFDSTGKEQQFLFCNEVHMAYTPLCRQGDMGRTPSEIISNELDGYEWQYQWRNFPAYHKFWNDSAYANSPANLFTDLERFEAMWAFDWSGSEITQTLANLGIQNPDPAVQSSSDYLAQLDNKFDAEISAANQMVVAYSQAMIQQAASERPVATVYDPYYGDVVQQGIILDKYFAMQASTGIWPVTMFDPSQAAGVYLSSFGGGVGDAAYASLGQAVTQGNLGGVPNVFPYFQPTAVALFAQDTNSPAFFQAGGPSVRLWIGAEQFDREQDFLSFFQNIAQIHSYSGLGCPDGNGNNGQCVCSPTQTCNYDPRLLADPEYWQFTGPDQRRYIYTYFQDTNQFITAEQDANQVTWSLLRGYNADINSGMDNGSNGAYGDEYQIKYTVESFLQYNGNATGN